MSLEGLLSQLQQLFLTWSKRLPAIDRPWSRFGSLTPWLHIHSENSASWSVLMGRSYKLPLPWAKSQCHAEHFLLYNILWSVSQMNFTSLKLVGSDNGSQRHRSNKSNLIQMNWNNQHLFIRGKQKPSFPSVSFLSTTLLNIHHSHYNSTPTPECQSTFPTSSMGKQSSHLSIYSTKWDEEASVLHIFSHLQIEF